MRAPAGVLAGALLLTAGCSAGADEPPASGGGGLTGTLTVFAAASLTDVFEELGERLTAEHPGLEVRFNFAGSSALATQVVEGAPADVLASANEAQMAVVAGEELAASEPEIFTSNLLQIAVPAGNPAGVTGLQDFARADLALALCSPEVPCGSAAEDVFADAGISPRPDTLEEGAEVTAIVKASDVLLATGS